MIFKKISEISLEDENIRDSVYITIDIDWAIDELLSDTIDLLEESNVKCTFFVTHDTPLISRIRSNENFEVGIHPNLNPLLHESNSNTLTARNLFEDLLEIVPEAKSFRCHSMANSSKILELAFDLGLKYDCNYFVPYQAKVHLKPWFIWNGILRIPYFWEDDVSLAYGVNESPEEMIAILDEPGLKVFDFHPIHISLNTNSLGLYEKSRDLHQKPGAVLATANRGYGTRDKFKFLLSKT